MVSTFAPIAVSGTAEMLTVRNVNVDQVPATSRFGNPTSSVEARAVCVQAVQEAKGSAGGVVVVVGRAAAGAAPSRAGATTVVTARVARMRRRFMEFSLLLFR